MKTAIQKNCWLFFWKEDVVTHLQGEEARTAVADGVGPVVQRHEGWVVAIAVHQRVVRCAVLPHWG